MSTVLKKIQRRLRKDRKKFGYTPDPRQEVIRKMTNRQRHRFHREQCAMRRKGAGTVGIEWLTEIAMTVR